MHGVSDTYKKAALLTVGALRGTNLFTRCNEEKRKKFAMNGATQDPGRDPAHFYRIAGEGAGLASHQALWRWLQGDVQPWLSHEVLLVGWGDFATGRLEHDIVSSLPGMRSADWSPRVLAPMLSHFRDCWAAAQHKPTQADATVCAKLLRAGGMQPNPFEGLRSALVHGLKPGPLRSERIFVVLSRAPATPPGAGQALTMILPFIDIALRQIPPCPRPGEGADRVSALSERERQIMAWVALGKTNPEIGCILDISEFTVKNHMKSIFSKLDVSNRAQAVAKLTGMAAHA